MGDRTVLRNEDFRRLLSTPARTNDAASTGAADTAKTAHSFTHKQHRAAERPAKKSKPFRAPAPKKEKTETDEIFDESEARLNEIMSKYRDRAAERRKGTMNSGDIELRAKLAAAGLRTFREDVHLDIPEADRREQEIRESKYLGGDLEHTHLVKGLDYSLLNKSRAEINNKDVATTELAEVDLSSQNHVIKCDYLNKAASSRMARSICRTLFETPPTTLNEHFQRGRMAYCVELEDAQGDVPVTLLRSTFECGAGKAEQNINASNMLINKLTDVLSYLRSDGRRKKKKGELDDDVATKADDQYKRSSKDAAVDKAKKSSDNIFDVDDVYVPSRSLKTDERGANHNRDYFGEGDHKSRDDRSGRDDHDRHRDSRHERDHLRAVTREEREPRHRDAPKSRERDYHRDHDSHHRDHDSYNRDRDSHNREHDSHHRDRDSRDERTSRHRDERDDYDSRDDSDRHRDYRRDSRRDVDSRTSTRRHDRPRWEVSPPSRAAEREAAAAASDAGEPAVKKNKVDTEDAYSELFPSTDAFYGGGDDSDDEDYSQMDAGSRKTGIRRWDFDTQDDFEKFQSGRTALPKAVFQYGVKTQGGNRKTRRLNAAAETKKLDRQYDEITKIMDRRGGADSSKA